MTPPKLKKRILAFCFFPAFVPPSNGGESRLFNFYKSLSKLHHVTLLTSSHLNIEEETIYHGSDFIERRIPKDSNFAKTWAQLSPQSSGGDLSAACITACGKHPTPMHDAYLEEHTKADIIIHDFPFTINYDLFLGVDNKIRIYNAHNCETSLYKALHPDPKSKPIWDLIQASETKILSSCDVVLYCSQDDLKAFKQLAPSSKYTAIYTPNGMTPLSAIDRQAASDKVTSCVFIGSSHPPNMEAALQITKNIAPALPEITFHIIGNCLPKGKYPKNVIRHGFVDDIVKSQLISNADLAINPMGLGSGSNVKVFDLFSYAIPVLSTEFGMRGIDAKHEDSCLIAPADNFAKLITLWSERYKELQQIGKNGQQLAIKNYSWDVIAKNVADKLSAIEKTEPNEKFILALNDYDSFKNHGGGGVRTRGIYKAVNEWVPVVFICFSENNEITVRNENNKTIVFCIPKTKAHIEAQKNVNSYFHVSADDIISHRYCRSNKLLISIYNALKELSRNIIVEHPYMASIPISFGDRFIYSSQNNETEIKRGLLRYHPMVTELINEVEMIERRTVECSAAVIAVSQQDATSFTRGVRTAGPIIVVNNGASEPLQPSEEELLIAGSRVEKDNSIVFIGSAHMPNIDAVKYIVEVLAPSSPDIAFHIIGSVCTAFDGANVDNIHFWGILSEGMKSAVMQSCRVAINTVINGGGSNIKLADYFANGLFVLTTPFGLRGYHKPVHDHLIVAELDDFKIAIKDALKRANKENKIERSKRRQLFDTSLSMLAEAKGIVSLLKNMEKPKNKVLFVTYRYTHPSLGGAESMLENLISSVNATNEFEIDVVSPEVSKIVNRHRFTENYEFDKNIEAKTGLKNVRFARFPINEKGNNSEQITAAWMAQIPFEKETYLQLKDSYERPGLAWGWSDPEGNSRWGFVSCGLHVCKKTKINISGYAPKPIVIWVASHLGYLIQTKKAEGSFDLDFIALEGGIEITSSSCRINKDDPRPLAFHMTALSFNDKDYDISKPVLIHTSSSDDSKMFQVFDKARQLTRDPLNISLTEMRGPFSSELEDYIENNISQYDLVVTHNSIFRPAVFAVEQANEAGIPVISIPHAHLDDDFYHFPDVQRSIVNSDLASVAPKATCAFYGEKGANVTYLPAGIDTNEVFEKADIEAFKNQCDIKDPFVLVLGRKSGAKGYQKVIDAVEQVSKLTDIHVVMIGPDDDGVPVTSAYATYLGRQSREVVRGALLSCRALVNMSNSESFGIVLLEAWLAGKPVIANNACAAFHDIAVDNQNALMVEDALSLQEAIKRVITDPALSDRLAKNGIQILKNHDWSNIGILFINSCKALINDRYTSN